MANVISKVAAIRDAILGQEVRESLASGIEAINTEVVSTTGRQTTLETNMDTAKTDAIEATSQANTARDNANDATATTNTATLEANTARDNANTKATLADSKATLAQTATDNADNAVLNINNNTLLIYKPWVANLAAIEATYPTPIIGWTTQTIDTNTRYRWDGENWINIGVYADDKTGDLGQISETNLVDAVLSDRSQLAETLTKTLSDITYYVNASTGLDINDGITNGTAFKTIQYAINSLPQVINHLVTINVASGTYNESINIQGFLGKSGILLYGGTSLNDAYIINNIFVERCTCIVIVRGFRANTTTSHSFKASESHYLEFNYCKSIASSAAYNGAQIQVSSAGVSNCEFSNKLNAICSTLSIIFSVNNAGNGNVVGLRAEHTGTIGKSETQPGGTTAESTVTGGEIR